MSSPFGAWIREYDIRRFPSALRGETDATVTIDSCAVGPVSPCIRLQPCKLEVWEWVLKCRIFDPFSEFSGLFLFMPEFSMNLHIQPFRVG